MVDYRRGAISERDIPSLPQGYACGLKALMRSPRLFFLNHHNARDSAPTVKTKLHASPRPDQVGVNCSAVLIGKADRPAEHIGHRLGVGRGLHDDRRGSLNGSQAGIERYHRSDFNCSGGDLRGRFLRLTRVLNGRSLCHGLPERQGRDHRANKNNNYSSHGFSFFELTFIGCFAERAPFGCLR